MVRPLVTVVIPVRDEAERLPACLEAVAAQDLAPGLVEVLVIDGGSTDGTVDAARRLLAGRGWARAEVLHSPAGDRSSNLNCGLAAASAALVVRVDARSRIPAHYLRWCAKLLEERTDIAVVGGRQRAVASGTRAVEVGVARALNNRWGMGLARYRRAGRSGEADTVYLGAYRTAELRAVGGWNTEFSVNEDFDLNRRLVRFGMVWFDVDLAVDYVPRSSLRFLIRQYWAFGQGKARYWRVSGDRPQLRQLGILAGPMIGLGAFVAAVAQFGPTAGGWLLLSGVVVALVLENTGADAPRGGPAVHLAALVALGCVAGAWLAGVAAGALRPVFGGRRTVRPVEQAA